MIKAKQSRRAAGLKPEEDMRTGPLLAGLAQPLGLDWRLIDFKYEPINGGAIEETQFNHARRVSDIRRPPLPESGGCRDQRIDRFGSGSNLKTMLDVGHLYAFRFTNNQLT
jgi:hypothetical protein